MSGYQETIDRWEDNGFSTDPRGKCFRHKEKICEVCGQTENIKVHHINGIRPDNRLKNLMPLCKDCHQAVHRGENHVSHLTEKLDTHTRFEKPSEEHIGAEMGD